MSGDVTTVANVSHPGEVEQTYGAGDGAVSFELDAEGHVVGVVDEAGRVETSAELDAPKAADGSDQLRQGEEQIAGQARTNKSGESSSSGNESGRSGAHDLYHGTDIKSAKSMVSKGIDRAAADQYGGDGKFYATTDLEGARTFAEANSAGGPPAVVGINLSTGLSGAVDQGLLTPMEGFPGAYTVENWEAFNSIATFTLVGFEP